MSFFCYNIMAVICFFLHLLTCHDTGTNSTACQDFFLMLVCKCVFLFVNIVAMLLKNCKCILFYVIPSGTYIPRSATWPLSLVRHSGSLSRLHHNPRFLKKFFHTWSIQPQLMLTWGNLWDFMQLPLKLQKASHNKISILQDL